VDAGDRAGVTATRRHALDIRSESGGYSDHVRWERLVNPRPKPSRGANSANGWHAVSIVTRSSSCEVALLGRTKRFLSLQAPHLPLPDCNHPEACACTYRHHDDRRAGPRRASETGRPRRLNALSMERRASPGRRVSDS
jgi:hypothetical protein